MDAACDSTHTIKVQEDHCASKDSANIQDLSSQKLIFNSVSAQVDDKNDSHTQDETSAREVAIQANDYDIERMSSHLPARKRYIPLKFNDYRIFAGGSQTEDRDDEEEEENEDSTFDPEKTNTKRTLKIPSGRGRGRPRKHAPLPEESSDSLEAKQEGTGKKSAITKVPSGFKCGICGRIFSLRGNAKAHMITHTDQRPFACDFEGCGKQLRTKESLRRHQLSHLELPAGERPFTCETCNKSFAHASDLNCHKIIHTGIKMFECPECKKKFSCNASLQEHIARHTGDKPLSCNVCGRKFRQVAVLKRHVTTHSSEKPFACGVCGKRFAMKVYVQSHMKTHTGERPFTCETCNKSFAHASDLNRHKIIHTGKKPYACSVCSMRYSDASSRRRHEREHQSKQQYICHLCNQCFTRAGQLRSHLIREHNTNTETVYEVQESWPVNNSQSKLVSMLQSVPGTITLPHEISEEGQTDDNFQDIALPSTSVQVFMNAPHSQPLTSNQKENLESTSQEESTKSLAAVTEVPATQDQLTWLPSVCTYKIIGQIEDSQIYELQLEYGNNFPIEEIACRVSMEDSQLQGTDTPLTVIQQKNNIYTVIPQQAPTNTAAQDESEILNSSHQWQIQSEMPQVHTTSSLQSGVLTAEVIKEEIGEVEAITDVSSALPADSNCKIASSIEMSNFKNEETIDKPDIVDERKDHEERDVSSEESNYVYNPDLSSQDYYNWLSTFTEECKLLPMPLDKVMFQKISHVQKILSDFMALPTGVITDKNNFKVLMSITHDLSDITSRHLTFMLQNLS